jgi:hypothetical protein
VRYVIDANGCWNFSGPLDQGGYGKISLKDKTFVAHRLMAHLTIRPITSTADVVAHKCDNPACINPEHLFITTQAGNQKDKYEKQRGAIGEKCHLSRLTAPQVLEVRQQHRDGKTMAQIARDLPVKYGAIQAIVRRHTWKHLP